MDVVISLVGMLGLIAGIVLGLLAGAARARARRAVLQAETELRISREAAARQLLELRKRLAEAESDQAHIASLQDEIRRLREKYRRLQALQTLDTGADRLGAGKPGVGPAMPALPVIHASPLPHDPEPNLGRPDASGDA